MRCIDALFLLAEAGTRDSGLVDAVHRVNSVLYPFGFGVLSA